MSGDNRSRPALPKDWEWKRLGELVRTSSGGTPSRKRPEFYENGTVPWLKIGDLNDAVVTNSDERITEAALQQSSARRLPAGTLLIAMYGSIGKLGLLGMEAATNQAICALETDDQVMRKFLYWYLHSRRHALLAAGFGGTQANISQRFLKQLPVPYPPRDDQRALLAAIEHHYEQIRVARLELSETERLIDRLGSSVLHRAFTGQLNRS